MDIHKDLLPAGWTYSLKPSRLEGAITEAAIRLPVSLYQSHKVWAVNAPALSAKFYPRGSYMSGADGRISVTSCAIPSDQREVVQEFAERVFLPALVAWIMSIEALPQDSTMRREEQDFACEGSPIALSKRPLPHLPKGQRRRKGA